jgi:hypothetical protein
MAREITDEYGNTIVIPDPFINLQGDNAFKTTTFGPGFDGEDTDDFNVIDLLNQYINAGFNTTGPQGTSNPEYKTLQAYLRQVYGDLPEGAVDWASGDLNGDGVNELYAVDADGNPHTVYGYDNDGNVTSTPYEEGTVFGGVASTGQGGDVSVILPPFLPPPAESKQTNGGTSGGGNVFDPTGGGILTGGGTLPPPPSESKPTDGGGNGGDDTDGPLDVLGKIGNTIQNMITYT